MNLVANRQTLRPRLLDDGADPYDNFMRQVIAQASIGIVGSRARVQKYDYQEPVRPRYFNATTSTEATVAEEMLNVAWYGGVKDKLIKLMPSDEGKDLLLQVGLALSSWPDWYDYVYSLVGNVQSAPYRPDGRLKYPRKANSVSYERPTFAGWRRLQGAFMLAKLGGGVLPNNLLMLPKKLPGIRTVCDYYQKAGVQKDWAVLSRGE